MPSTTPARNESGDGIPRRAVTADRGSLLKCLLAKGARLFCVARRSRACSGADSNSSRSELSWRVRQRVLRDYHAANLATARAVSEELVRAGFNIGDVPYGYRAHRVRMQPPGRRPRWRIRLAIEPVEASTVRMIFLWCGEDRLSLTEIRRRLAVSRYPAPLDLDFGSPACGRWRSCRSGRADQSTADKRRPGYRARRHSPRHRTAQHPPSRTDAPKQVTRTAHIR